MYILFLSSLFMALVAMYSVHTVPEQEQQMINARASVNATNFMAYRRALVDYVASNPTATGEVDDDELEPFYLPGYTRNTNWRNMVSGATIFVYSTEPMEKVTQYRIYEMSGNSLLVGHKNASTGRLVSITGMDTGVNVPAAIPNAAFVMMGN
jgi:hypothetical protein